MADEIHIVSTIGRYVVLHGLKREEDLNGVKGIVTGYQKDRWNVTFLDQARVVAIRCENIAFVNINWIDEVRAGPMRNSMVSMMLHFKAPGAWMPPPFTVFTDAMNHPTLEMTKDWWGTNVFSFTTSVLQRQIATRQKRGALLWAFAAAFQRGEVRMGMIYSDGTKQSQQSPLEERPIGQCWWPCLLCSYDSQCTDIVAYCQGMALQGSRPWTVNVSRVFLFNNSTPAAHVHATTADAPPHTTNESGYVIVETPGVLIEEIDSETDETDEDSTVSESWDFVDSPCAPAAGVWPQWV